MIQEKCKQREVCDFRRMIYLPAVSVIYQPFRILYKCFLVKPRTAAKKAGTNF